MGKFLCGCEARSAQECCCGYWHEEVKEWVGLTKEELIRMAREAGWPDSLVAPVIMDKLAEFAALVAATERENCAQVCDDMTANEAQRVALMEASRRIRARGQE